MTERRPTTTVTPVTLMARAFDWVDIEQRLRHACRCGEEYVPGRNPCPACKDECRRLLRAAGFLRRSAEQPLRDGGGAA